MKVSYLLPFLKGRFLSTCLFISVYLSILYLAAEYIVNKFDPTYELIPEPVPLLEQGGGDDETVDKGKQNRPEHN